MEITAHALERLMERLDKMTNNDDITEQEATEIRKTVNKIVKKEFDSFTSYGIMFGRFAINPESRLVTEKHNSGVYYEINSLDHQDVMRDSTGNEFWGIIRGNRMVTAFLRKTVQSKTAHKPRNQGGLGVDVVIKNFNNFK